MMLMLEEDVSLSHVVAHGQSETSTFEQPAQTLHLPDKQFQVCPISVISYQNLFSACKLHHKNAIGNATRQDASCPCGGGSSVS